MPTPPKRSDQKRFRGGPPVDKVPTEGDVAIPDADQDWHPLAVRWYDSLKVSGQSIYLEPSDWAMAAVAAELLSRQLASGRLNAQVIAAWVSMAGSLLTTETDRRKAHIEIERSINGEPLEQSLPGERLRRDPKARLRAVPAS